MMHTGGKVRSAVLAVMIAGAGCLTVGLISGLLYEQSQRARDRQRLPQVGRTVDIGGRSLNLFCSGTGQPPVLFESGATWPLYTTPKGMFENGSPRPGYIWVAIQRDLAKVTTACWYDRAGSGWSELGPYPRDSGAQARDLHALLQAAGVAGPYVLVAESSAALDPRVYAREYRTEVAGLVFVNGAHPDLFGERRGRRRARIPGFVLRSQDVAAQFFNAVGLYRLGPVNDALPRPVPAGITEQEWATISRLAKGSRARSALMQDIAAWDKSTSEARQAGSLADLPLAVVYSRDTPLGAELADMWLQQEAELAALSTRATSVAVDGADPIFEAPGVVVDAVKKVLAQAAALDRAAKENVPSVPGFRR